MCQLAYVHFMTPQLAQMRAFYELQMGFSALMTQPHVGSQTASQYENIFLHGPQGLIGLSAGPVAQLQEVGLEVFAERWQEAQHRLKDLGAQPVLAHPIFAKALTLNDPEGNRLVFGCTPRITLARQNLAQGLRLSGTLLPQPPPLPPPACLQHFGLGTQSLSVMNTFYQERLGFLLSDDVSAENGVLRSSFLRGTEEHHLVALFGNGKPGFDHMSFEAPDWNGIRDWSDHFAKFETRIFWGAGRHGVGNNLFIFVLDPDQHMVEISAELEIVPLGKPAGHWAFDYKAFNIWGPAALRV